MTIVWKIVLIPLTPIDLKYEICQALSTILRVKCRVDRPLDIPLERFFVHMRFQYNSDLILTHLQSTLRIPNDHKVLAIADADAFVDGLNFVFGEAEYGGKIAVIYLSRLKHKRKEVYMTRAVKEALHELGHTFMLRHCRNKRCVMSFSNSIRDVDTKGDKFCGKCAMHLKRMGVDVNENYIL